jgi:hypothetical protein
MQQPDDPVTLVHGVGAVRNRVRRGQQAKAFPPGLLATPAIDRQVVERSPQVTFGVAADGPPALDHSLQRVLQEILSVGLTASQQDRGTRQVLALVREQLLEHRDGLFAVHPAPLIASTHQVRSAADGG